MTHSGSPSDVERRVTEAVDVDGLVRAVQALVRTPSCTVPR